MSDQFEQTSASPNHDEIIRFELLKTLEYYFSSKNLLKDDYLKSQMDAESYVSIDEISKFNKIKKLTSDLALIKEIIQLSSQLELDPQTESKLRSINGISGGSFPLKPPAKTQPPQTQRSILILREVSPDATLQHLIDLFNDKEPLCPSCEKCESAGNESWYVTFSSEEDAQRALQYLKGEVQVFMDKPIKARIKAHAMPRSNTNTIGSFTQPLTLTPTSTPPPPVLPNPLQPAPALAQYIQHYPQPTIAFIPATSPSQQGFIINPGLYEIPFQNWQRPNPNPVYFIEQNNTMSPVSIANNSSQNSSGILSQTDETVLLNQSGNKHQSSEAHLTGSDSPTKLASMHHQFAQNFIKPYQTNSMSRHQIFHGNEGTNYLLQSNNQQLNLHQHQHHQTVGFANNFAAYPQAYLHHLNQQNQQNQQNQASYESMLNHAEHVNQDGKQMSQVQVSVLPMQQHQQYQQQQQHYLIYNPIQANQNLIINPGLVSSQSQVTVGALNPPVSSTSSASSPKPGINQQNSQPQFNQQQQRRVVNEPLNSSSASNLNQNYQIYPKYTNLNLNQNKFNHQSSPNKSYYNNYSGHQTHELNAHTNSSSSGILSQSHTPINPDQSAVNLDEDGSNCLKKPSNSINSDLSSFPPLSQSPAHTGVKNVTVSINSMKIKRGKEEEPIDPAIISYYKSADSIPDAPTIIKSNNILINSSGQESKTDTSETLATILALKTETKSAENTMPSQHHQQQQQRHQNNYTNNYNNSYRHRNSNSNSNSSSKYSNQNKRPTDNRHNSMRNSNSSNSVKSYNHSRNRESDPARMTLALSQHQQHELNNSVSSVPSSSASTPSATQTEEDMINTINSCWNKKLTFAEIVQKTGSSASSSPTHKDYNDSVDYLEQQQNSVQSILIAD